MVFLYIYPKPRPTLNHLIPTEHQPLHRTSSHQSVFKSLCMSLLSLGGAREAAPAGQSHHGGLRKCQDHQKWQLLPICECAICRSGYFRFWKVFSNWNFVHVLLIAPLSPVNSSFPRHSNRENSSVSTLTWPATSLGPILRRVSFSVLQLFGHIMVHLFLMLDTLAVWHVGKKNKKNIFRTIKDPKQWSNLSILNATAKLISGIYWFFTCSLGFHCVWILP